jgi:hypothetical protein
MMSQRARGLALLLVAGSVAACQREQPAADTPSAPATSSAEAKATPAPTPSSSSTAPVSAARDIAALAGRWRVTRLAVGDGVQALAADDPAYVGQRLVLGTDRFAWATPRASGATLSDVCDGPALAPLPEPGAGAEQRQHATALARLGVTKADALAVECDRGTWGPEAAGGAILFPAGDDRLAMSWYDGGMLLLVREPDPR